MHGIWTISIRDGETAESQTTHIHFSLNYDAHVKLPSADVIVSCG